MLQHLLLLLLQDICLLVQHVSKQMLHLPHESNAAAAGVAGSTLTLGFFSASASLKAFKIAALRAGGGEEMSRDTSGSKQTPYVHEGIKSVVVVFSRHILQPGWLCVCVCTPPPSNSPEASARLLLQLLRPPALGGVGEEGGSVTC